MLRPAVAVCCIIGCFLFVEQAGAETGLSVELILDASGSMNAKLPDGATRIEAAKNAVARLVEKLAPDTRLALRVYGHQSSVTKRDCKDSNLVVGFGESGAHKAAVVERARKVNAQGYTPIYLSLQLAARDLAGEESAERVVLLVSDGKETCEGDPCAAAKALADADARLVMHTIGFGVDTVTRQQLTCIARVARGRYYDAVGASDLADVLGKAARTKAVSPEPPYQQAAVTVAKTGKLKMDVGGQFSHDVLDASGKKVETLLSIRRVVELPPGIYSVRFGNGSWMGLEVKVGETTEIKPGVLEIKPTGSALIQVLEPETGEVVEEILFSKPRVTLIPSRFDVRFGKILWPGGIELRPGETTTLEPGVLQVKSKLGIFGFVLKTQDGAVAATGSVPGQPRVVLPAGTYHLEIDPDKAIKQLPDAQRRKAIKLDRGQVYDVSVE